MDPYPLRDPRDEALQPAPEEVEAWASRERKRREAWIAGPTEHERHEWAHRYRQRARLGFGDARLGPTDEEIAEWAEREHHRRQAWLAGPTDEEKREWAHRSHETGFGPDRQTELLPTQDEIDAWAEQERRRRQAWLAGPTQDEKRRWVRRQTGRRWGGTAGGWEPDPELVDSAERLLRDAELAAKGSIDVLLRAPFAIWSYLVRSGRRFEQEGYEPPPRRRVRF
jgi:hypothetical protein